MLVNGKNTGKFIDTDMKEVQKIINRELQKTGNPSLKKLNDEFSVQIQTLMQNRTVQRASEPIRQSLKPIEYSDHTCPKCKKNVKSRGTFCTAGNHWIHYNCERLKTHEIEQLEKSSNTSDEYSCKICSKNTSPQTKISLYIPNVDNPSGDMFENILSEEQLQAEDEIALDICTVCEQELPLENTDVCELCDLPCHKECMVDAGSPICLFCEANEDHVDNITSDSQLNISQDIAVNDCTNTECDTLQTIDKNSILVINPNCDESVDRSTEAPKSKPSNMDEISTKLNDIKLSELRKKESKLRKWEKELEYREKTLTEVTKERNKMESYTKKIETRNLELESTIKTLQRKIDSIENNTRPASDNINTQNNSIQMQLQRINDRVATFVLNQIDLQFQKLENTFELNTTLNSVSTDNHNEEQLKKSEAGRKISSNDVIDLTSNTTEYNTQKLKINYDYENQKQNKLEQKEQRTVESLTGPPLHFRSKKVKQTVPVSQVSKPVKQTVEKTNLHINSINSVEKVVNKDNIQSERQQLNGRRSVTAIFNDLCSQDQVEESFLEKSNATNNPM